MSFIEEIVEREIQKSKEILQTTTEKAIRQSEIDKIEHIIFIK
ncbi:hypothetical protein [Capnocytophaga cynodegmi]|uniref:Uncharacterized protein n=1 Tax=Capnocytophaga cynodegmi TaxID=28189 RepID=A0A0B7HI46_9FLAO|nr:hypothetical protein [Capnocytophaga cynodegmi]CEN38319.1 hypothetical protein CCYN2B_50020 [Capnocytophaga cynodegmi]